MAGSILVEDPAIGDKEIVLNSSIPQSLNSQFRFIRVKIMFLNFIKDGKKIKGKVA